ncbi:MAG: hypothetical protein JOZ36_11175 [Acidobacteria bacterium]|nr:hypothetical protein [Acidobacteriota bacterium]
MTVTYGLRYVRDTGRSDSDLPPIPFLNRFNNQFYSGLGNRVNNPNTNFAPQLGVAWDPTKNGSTVIRAGIGLFYENAIWNNVLFDRPVRLSMGRFLATQPACVNGAPIAFALPGTNTPVNPTFCGQPIGQVQSQIASLQAQYQAAAAAGGNGLAPNPSFIATAKADTGPNGSGTDLFFPGYRTPRSVQMNIGAQHEIHKGVVLTADYLRNVSTHTLLAIDTNHVGDARFLNVPNAKAAIAKTLTACGVGSIDAAIAACPGLHPGPATIADFAMAGLDSGYSAIAGGAPCPTCAFPGITPNLGGNQMLFPIGRSVYNGLQISLKQDVQSPFTAVHSLNLQVSYALSRYISQAQDGDFINSAWSYADPSRYIGPNGLDRTHQLSFGGTVEFPKAVRLNLISHFYSPLAQNLTIATTGAPGGIFVTDALGDGTGDGNLPNGSNGALGSIVPGTNIGSFGRDVSAADINRVISNYNNNFAGKPTPAGQALINAGLFTNQQLISLGAVMPQINPAPAGQVGNGWLHATDMSLNWVYKFKERVTLQPGVSFFNLLNFANYDPPKNIMSGVLSTVGTTPVIGSANGTAGKQPDSLRVGLGSGVFGLGSPRVIEFNLKLTF